jgi:hypothetical protein
MRSEPQAGRLQEIVRRREDEIKRLKRIKADMKSEYQNLIDDLHRVEAEEISKLEERIQSIKSSTAALVADHSATLEREIKPINDGIANLRRQNDLILASVSPIGKLPNEILGLIFQAYVDMNYSVYILMQVSERWKHIASRTYSLWAKILVLSDKQIRRPYEKFVDGTYKGYYTGSKHVCFDGDGLFKLASRAGVYPLEISIVYDGISQSVRRPHKDDIIHLLSSIQTLMVASFSSRVRYLHISIYCDLPSGKLPVSFQDISLPNLKDLFILNMPKSWFRHMLQSISKTTRNLRSFTCAMQGSSPLLSNRIWNNIESLSLRGSDAETDLDELVGKISNVEELKGVPSLWPSNTTPPGTFYRLPKITLNTDPSSMRLISWFNLQQLEVNDINSQSDTILTFADYPKLQSLRLTTYRPHHWLSNVSMPELTTLHLTLNARNRHTRGPNGAPLSSCPKVQSLKLYTKWDDEMTITLLEALPNVVSVAIIPLGKDVQCGLDLLPQLTEYSDSFVLCPSLEILVLGQSTGGVHNLKAVLVPMIKHTIAFRTAQGCPFQRIEVFWNSSQESQIYI